MTHKREWIGDWLLMDRLGAGGQGEVHKARRIPRKGFRELAQSLKKEIREIGGMVQGERPEYPPVIDPMYDLIELFADSELGAVKKLHSPEKAKNPQTAKQRFAREIDTLREVEHPALIRILDCAEDKAWYVMEYHERGPLSNHRDQYKGDFYGALRALRPVVQGVALLHEGGLVHRDIKPDNIFVAGDGRLVLGDLGLVLDQGDSTSRVTEPYENVGSWNWMPTWAQGARLEEVPPAFDVFTLGKVLWAMLSGKSFLRLHYFHNSEFDLEELFPAVPEMKLANDFLDKCVVEDAEKGASDAGELLEYIDSALGTRSARGSAPILGSRGESVDPPDEKIDKLKAYIVDDRYRIRLEEMVGDEVSEVCTALSGADFQIAGEPTPDAVVDRVPRYEDLMRPLLRLCGTGCYHAAAGQYGLWGRALTQVVETGIRAPSDRLPFVPQKYPALLFLYCGGIAAVASEKYALLAVLVAGARSTSEVDRDLTAIMPVGPLVLPSDVINRLQGVDKNVTALSDRVSEVLRTPLLDVIDDKRRYERSFDRLEFLLTLVYLHTVGEESWRPVNGRFMRNPEMRKLVLDEATKAGNGWPPLKAGLFDGTPTTFQRVWETHEQRARKRSALFL